jgi:hypothetical protein
VALQRECCEAIERGIGIGCHGASGCTDELTKPIIACHTGFGTTY